MNAGSSSGITSLRPTRAAGSLTVHCHRDIIGCAEHGCLVTFETSSAAVVFTLRRQQIRHFEPDLRGVRIGVHTGDVSTGFFEGMPAYGSETHWPLREATYDPFVDAFASSSARH